MIPCFSRFCKSFSIEKDRRIPSGLWQSAKGSAAVALEPIQNALEEGHDLVEDRLGINAHLLQLVVDALGLADELVDVQIQACNLFQQVQILLGYWCALRPVPLPTIKDSIFQFCTVV